MTLRESESEVDGCHDESFSGIQVDESLETRLKAHGISRRNVRSIIREVFTDENVLKLLRNAGSQSEELDLPEVPLTRSKRQDAGLEIEEYNFSDNFMDDDPELLALENPNANETLNSVSDLNVNTDSCFDDNGDFNWQTWLTELDNGKNDKISNEENADDSDSDPDYNFLEDTEEKDADDYRDDRMTRISKKELKSLIKKKKAPEKHIEPRSSKLSPTDKIELMDNFLKSKTMREKLKIIRCNPEMKVQKKEKKKRKLKLKYLSFSAEQSDILKQQMQQHVQLLCQTCVLDLDQHEYLAETRKLLLEFQYFKSYSLSPEMSYFNVPLLKEANELVTTLPNHESLSCDVEDTKAQLIANSPVFMYKELLPMFLSPIMSTTVKKFSFHEDCLIALGLSEMSNCLNPPATLINEYMMPCRAKTAIESRVKTILRGNVRQSASNPVLIFKNFGILPPPCGKVSLVMMENITCPASMKGDLPEWLERLQHSTPDLQTEHHSTGTQEDKECMTKSLMKKSPRKPSISWSKAMDGRILAVCKKYGGPNKDALGVLALEFPKRKPNQIKNRFRQLIEMFIAEKKT